MENTFGLGPVKCADPKVKGRLKLSNFGVKVKETNLSASNPFPFLPILTLGEPTNGTLKEGRV